MISEYPACLHPGHAHEGLELPSAPAFPCCARKDWEATSCLGAFMLLLGPLLIMVLLEEGRNVRVTGPTKPPFSHAPCTKIKVQMNLSIDINRLIFNMTVYFV